MEEDGVDHGQVMSLKTKIGFVLLVVVIVGGFLVIKNK